MKVKRLCVFLAEMALGAFCGLIAAVILVPLVTTERGYFAIGAEWLVIIFVAFSGFSAVNTIFFKTLERKSIERRR